MNWIECMNDAIDYIEDHLDDKIDNHVISQKVCCSMYNFQRVFSFVLNQPLSDYIRSRRLTLAGEELRGSKGRIIDLAIKYGYESQEAFTRAFIKFHGVTPTSARLAGSSLNTCPKAIIDIQFDKGDARKNMKPNKYMLTKIDPNNLFYKGVKGPGTLLFSVSLWTYFEFMGQNHDPARTYTIIASLSGDAYHAGITMPTVEGMSRALEILQFNYHIYSTNKNEPNYLDEASAKQKIVESISVHKHPAIVCNLSQCCFGGVIAGYEDDGNTLINWGFYPFDDRDKPDPILTPCKDWYPQVPYIIILGDRKRIPGPEEIYTLGLKGAYHYLADNNSMKNDHFYEEWKRFLRLSKSESIFEVKQTHKVPGTWNTLEGDDLLDESILKVLNEMIDPLWCDFAERRFFAAQYIQQAKEYVPMDTHELMERISTSFFQIHDCMFEYIKLVDLEPGSDNINMQKFYDPAVREKMIRIIDQCKLKEKDAMYNLQEVIERI